VILAKEPGLYRKKDLEGLLNGVDFEIKSVEGDAKNTLKRCFYEGYKKGAKHLVLYFPFENIFSIDKLNRGYRMFRGKNNYEYKSIWYIVNEVIYVFK